MSLSNNHISALNGNFSSNEAPVVANITSQDLHQMAYHESSFRCSGMIPLEVINNVSFNGSSIFLGGSTISQKHLRVSISGKIDA